VKKIKLGRLVLNKTKQRHPKPQAIAGERRQPQATAGDRRRPQATAGDRRQPQAKVKSNELSMPIEILWTIS